jgi:hypothetical protein
VLADGDFSRTRLVVLSSCGSGAHIRTARALQRYRSVDAAFLAPWSARNVIHTLGGSDFPALIMLVPFRAGIHGGQHPLPAYRRAVEYLRTAAWRRASSGAAVERAHGVLDAVVPN